MDREVNKHGRAGWQGNEISSKEAFRGSFDHEVNKKRKHLLPHWVATTPIDILFIELISHLSHLKQMFREEARNDLTR